MGFLLLTPKDATTLHVKNEPIFVYSDVLKPLLTQIRPVSPLILNLAYSKETIGLELGRGEGERVMKTKISKYRFKQKCNRSVDAY